jgi:hypothetical protein
MSGLREKLKRIEAEKEFVTNNPIQEYPIQQPYQQPMPEQIPETEQYQQPYQQQPEVYQDAQEFDNPQLAQQREEESLFSPNQIFPVPSSHYTEQAPYEYGDKDETSPLKILDEIRKFPSPKGTFPTIIGGRPIDFNDLESYMLSISPHGIRTILRYHNARTIEEMKNYARLGGLTGGGKGGKFWIMIMLFIGMAVLGLVMLLFLPQIMEMFSSQAGGLM